MSCAIDRGESFSLVFHRCMRRLFLRIVAVAVVSVMGHIHGLALLHCSIHNSMEHVIVVLKYSAIAQPSLNRNCKKYIRRHNP